MGGARPKPLYFGRKSSAGLPKSLGSPGLFIFENSFYDVYVWRFK